MLGIGGLIGQLVEDLRGLARAEIRLFKSRAFDAIRRYRTAIILLLGASAIVFASLIALLLGFVLALAPMVGAALAGLIVLAGGGVIAALLAWIAIRLLAGPDIKPATAPPTMDRAP
jgi:hypothetical protein